MSKKQHILVIFFCLCLLIAKGESVSQYDVIWQSQSKNSSESMPCGGGDIGLNVWVEKGDILFYMSRSGSFDENNTLLKNGRMRIKLTPNPFDGNDFEQRLALEEGCLYIKGRNGDIISDIRIWVDVFNPVIQIDIANSKKLSVDISYENWRYQDRLLRKNESNQNSYKWAAPQDLQTLKDETGFDGNRILFYHRNKEQTVFDKTVDQQRLSLHRHRIYNPLENLIFGGYIEAERFEPGQLSEGTYTDTDYKSWSLTSKEKVKKCNIRIKLHTEQTDIATWKNNLYKPAKSDRKANIAWWKNFWSRSYIFINEPKDTEAYRTGRNYQLFRYMLACNAYGDFPTKFNGGLFTYDPVSVDTIFRFTPDFRKWGGGTHTAQNQRLVYFPMLKSGDTDMMKPQFDFYNRLLKTAELRSQVYWGHSGACFCEQIENFGLPNPSEYGWKRPDGFDKGLEYNAWLEYQWDTALEFCQMIMESRIYAGNNISEYIPLIKSTLRFFDEHYQYRAKGRGRKALNEDGKLVLYPGSACETYKMAYNAASTIAALQTVTKTLLEQVEIQNDSTDAAYFEGLQNRIPEIPLREQNGHTTIAPARLWERVNNIETPQLYPVFPWRIYGIGKHNLNIALNTWKYDADAIKFRSHTGWKQDAIWAANLGLTDEAFDLVCKKLDDSPNRFPAFWGPGYDWTPDHNWGGSGMIALQDMLLQTNGNQILLLPAWPKNIDVHFKLHAPQNTTVECWFEKGEIKKLEVLPKNRQHDIVTFN